MGWTYTYRSPNQTIKDFLAEHVNCENERKRWRLLDCAIVHLRTAYMAVEIIDKNEAGELDQSTRKVVAFVFLLDYRPKDHYNTGYKDMDETMRPYQCDCPERILRLLTPTDSEYAVWWRESCWKKIKRRKERIRPKVGDIIRSEQPLRYSDGVVRQQFQVLSTRPFYARCLKTGVRCKLNGLSRFAVIPTTTSLEV